jgi:hypothetical protein
MFNFIFFPQFSPEQLVTPAVPEPASEDDQTSYHQ